MVPTFWATSRRPETELTRRSLSRGPAPGVQPAAARCSLHSRQRRASARHVTFIYLSTIEVSSIVGNRTVSHTELSQISRRALSTRTYGLRYALEGIMNYRLSQDSGPQNTRNYIKERNCPEAVLFAIRGKLKHCLSAHRSVHVQHFTSAVSLF